MVSKSKCSIFIVERILPEIQDVHLTFNNDGKLADCLLSVIVVACSVDHRVSTPRQEGSVSLSEVVVDLKVMTCGVTENWLLPCHTRYFAIANDLVIFLAEHDLWHKIICRKPNQKGHMIVT